MNEELERNENIASALCSCKELSSLSDLNNSEAICDSFSEVIEGIQAKRSC